MNSPASNEPESDLATPRAHAEPTTHHDHLDPLTGEPHAHPLGVGVGALSAGAAGAAIGAFAGPIGVVVGAAIGAIAGGLAGKEVAESPEISPTAEEGGTLDEFDHAATETRAEDEVPLSTAISERTSPADDDFFTGGSVSSRHDAESEAPLDDFDRPHGTASAAAASAPAATTAFEDKPLPTASSGLITPDEESFFADSATAAANTTGESATLVEDPYPAAHAVSPGDRFADVPSEAAATGTAATSGSLDTEQTVRTGAYYRFLGRERTGEPGSEFDDWIAAEKEVTRR